MKNEEEEEMLEMIEIPSYSTIQNKTKKYDTHFHDKEMKYNMSF